MKTPVVTVTTPNQVPGPPGPAGPAGPAGAPGVGTPPAGTPDRWSPQSTAGAVSWWGDYPAPAIMTPDDNGSVAWTEGSFRDCFYTTAFQAAGNPGKQYFMMFRTPVAASIQNMLTLWNNAAGVPLNGLWFGVYQINPDNSNSLLGQQSADVSGQIGSSVGQYLVTAALPAAVPLVPGVRYRASFIIGAASTIPQHLSANTVASAGFTNCGISGSQNYPSAYGATLYPSGIMPANIAAGYVYQAAGFPIIVMK